MAPLCALGTALHPSDMHYNACLSQFATAALRSLTLRSLTLGPSSQVYGDNQISLTQKYKFYGCAICKAEQKKKGTPRSTMVLCVRYLLVFVGMI